MPKWKKEDPPCEACQHREPLILANNRPILWLINQMGSVLFDGMGGVNAGVIKLFLDDLNVPKEERLTVLKKISLFASARLAASRENKNG
jgi:hypothetical protein